jgi:hypothetical protein
MTGVIDWLLHLGEHYPDLVALLLGTAAGYALGLLAEAYVIDPTMSGRHQKGLTVLITVAGATLMSSLIWHGLDAAAPLALRLSVSFACGLLAPFWYPAIARAATSRWPGIGTIWEFKP